MGSIWPWLIGGAILIGGYFFVYKPLSSPGGRQILGGFLSGDTKSVNKGIVSVFESNPQLRAQYFNTPEKMKEYNKAKQMYGSNYVYRSGYRY